MPQVASAKSGVGRQSQLPFKRAFKISINSLKIRFWRSIITAGGIFLGISFLTAVLAQWLMQWPVPEKVDAGFVRIGGQINGPGDYEVWKPIPVQVGLEAGLSEEVVERVSNGGGAFQLARVVQGKIDLGIDERKVVRLNEEWVGLRKIKDQIAFYVDVAADKEIKVSDGRKMGVPSSALKRVAGKSKTFLGGDLADIIREQPDWIAPLHAAAALDQDISIKDAVKGGVPETVAKRLAGEGRTFKAGPLNDAIKAHPDQIKLWSRRLARNSIYRNVDDAAVARLGERYATTLNEALAEAKKFAGDADKSNVMVVSRERKYSANFGKEGEKAGAVKLADGDNITVPDLNSKYRMIWLVVMALLVSSVGITNSMLMSVTERFKEIGTMKCLGALDSFVVLLFMLESSMMGLVASVLGWIVGFSAMVLLAGFSKGWDMVANIEFASVMYTFVGAVGIGLLITMVATIAPAKRAADMPAAMALRSEI